MLNNICVNNVYNTTITTLERLKSLILNEQSSQGLVSDHLVKINRYTKHKAKKKRNLHTITSSRLFQEGHDMHVISKRERERWLKKNWTWIQNFRMCKKKQTEKTYLKQLVMFDLQLELYPWWYGIHLGLIIIILSRGQRLRVNYDMASSSS